MSKLSRQGCILVITPKGALRAEEVQEMRNEISIEMRGGLPLVTIDLCETQLIDGAGLEWILELDEQCGERGGAVRLCNAGDLCQDVLRITCVGDSVDHYTSLVDALRSFSQ